MESTTPEARSSSNPGRRFALTLGFGFLFCLTSLILAMTVILPGAEPPPIPAHLVLPKGTDAWDAGRKAYDAGDWDTAVAYWRQVPKDHPGRGRALRYIGWEVYASEKGEPREALRYVNRCVIEQPFDGNTWQDLGRTYAAVLGLPVK